MMEDVQLYPIPTTDQLVAALRRWGNVGGCEGAAQMEAHLRPKYQVLNVYRAANELVRMRDAIKAMHTGLTAGSCQCEDCK